MQNANIIYMKFKYLIFLLDSFIGTNGSINTVNGTLAPFIGELTGIELVLILGWSHLTPPFEFVGNITGRLVIFYVLSFRFLNISL